MSTTSSITDTLNAHGSSFIIRRKIVPTHPLNGSFCLIYLCVTGVNWCVPHSASGLYIQCCVFGVDTICGTGRCDRIFRVMLG